MEMDLWKNDFKKYMDFIYCNKRYPNKSKDIDELYLFNWAKKQRCLYTKSKLSCDKIKLLKEFKFWYFKSIDKNKQITNIKNFFSDKIEENKNTIIMNHIINNSNNNNVIINISNLNIYYEKQENIEKNSIFDILYNKIKGYINYFVKKDENLYLENV